jgi:hypothetical protein
VNVKKGLRRLTWILGSVLGIILVATHPWDLYFYVNWLVVLFGVSLFGLCIGGVWAIHGIVAFSIQVSQKSIVVQNYLVYEEEMKKNIEPKQLEKHQRTLKRLNMVMRVTLIVSIVVGGLWALLRFAQYLYRIWDVYGPSGFLFTSIEDTLTFIGTICGTIANGLVVTCAIYGFGNLVVLVVIHYHKKKSA